MMNSKTSNRRRTIMSIGAIALLAAGVIGALSNRSDTEEMVFVPPIEQSVEIIEVQDETVYNGGPVAFVDYSVDPQGECVVVWYSEGRFGQCADAVEGWQTMFLRPVPAGTDYAIISREWNDVFAPENWR